MRIVNQLLYVPLYLIPLADSLYVQSCQFYRCSSSSFGGAISISMKEYLENTVINYSTFIKCTGESTVYLDYTSKNDGFISKCALIGCKQCLLVNKENAIQLTNTQITSCQGSALLNFQSSKFNTLNATNIEMPKRSFMFIFQGNNNTKLNFIQIQDFSGDIVFFTYVPTLEIDSSNFLTVLSTDLLYDSDVTFRDCMFDNISGLYFGKSKFINCYTTSKISMPDIIETSSLVLNPIEPLEYFVMDFGQGFITGKQTRIFTIDAGSSNVLISDAIFENLSLAYDDQGIIFFDLMRFNVLMQRNIFSNNILHTESAIISSMSRIDLKMCDFCFYNNFAQSSIFLRALTSESIEMNRTTFIMNDIISKNIKISRAIDVKSISGLSLNVSYNGILSSTSQIEWIKFDSNTSITDSTFLNNSLMHIINGVSYLSILKTVFDQNSHQVVKCEGLFATNLLVKGTLVLYSQQEPKFVNSLIDIVKYNEVNREFDGTTHQNLSLPQRRQTCFGDLDPDTTTRLLIIVIGSILGALLISGLVILTVKWVRFKRKHDLLQSRINLQDSIMGDFG